MWQARSALSAIEKHHPGFDVRARLFQSGEGPVWAFWLAAPEGTKPAELAPLGRALYHDPALGALDVFITDANWEQPRPLHSACPSGSTASACCLGPLPAGSPAVPQVQGEPRVPAGGAVADGTYVLRSMHGTMPAPGRVSRVVLSIEGSQLRSAADWDTDWTGQLDCPPQCETYHFRVDGTRLLATKICPECHDKDCEAAFGFTATDGEITLFTGEGAEPRSEMTFVRR
jgi:hypothetical protein